jgi:hypothetical protein
MILLAIGLYSSPLPTLPSALAPSSELLSFLTLAAGLTAVLILHTRLLKKR